MDTKNCQNSATNNEQSVKNVKNVKSNDMENVLDNELTGGAERTNKQ